MNKRVAKRSSIFAPHKSATGPIRWDELPHKELRYAAKASMAFGSRARASEDAKLHVLTQRLWKLDAVDHMKYIEIINARTVEVLRAIRDEYRGYLQKKGAKPIAEMQWVVVRYGVMDWAVMALREAIFEYIGHCRISTEHWEALFCIRAPVRFRSQEPVQPKSETVNADTALLKTIEGFITQNVFDEVRPGGPFGRHNQMRLARATPKLAFQTEGETLLDEISIREKFWDHCCPWTEGLAMLFDAAQQEVVSQFDGLGDDAHLAESLLINLPAFRRIAYEHLMGMKSREPSIRNLGEARWLALLRELDESGILLHDELQGKAREVLMAVRKKGQAASTWAECYQFKSSVILDSGKRYTLKREITHAIHNAARLAANQLAKVWGSKTRT
jgi:hypothetical protein